MSNYCLFHYTVTHSSYKQYYSVPDFQNLAHHQAHCNCSCLLNELIWRNLIWLLQKHATLLLFPQERRKKKRVREDVIEEERRILNTFNNVPSLKHLSSSKHTLGACLMIFQSLSSQITLQSQVTRWELPAVLVLNHRTGSQSSFKWGGLRWTSLG